MFKYLLGKNYIMHRNYNSLVNDLHENKLDRLEIQIWLHEMDLVVPFSISSLKKFFFKEAMVKVKSSIEFDDLLIKYIETKGIVCIDEFDKIVKSKSDFAASLSSASDENVQNDLLPLLDGTDIDVQNSKMNKTYLNTRNILFVASGAFSKSSIEDLIPEIQGRLPNKIKVSSLRKFDFINILNHSKKSATRLITKLLLTENIEIRFTNEAIETICEIADLVNHNNEYLGARQLIAVVDKILEEVNYTASEIADEFGKEGHQIVWFYKKIDS